MKFHGNKGKRFNTNLTHFKMYKDGKRWVFAASAFLMLGGGLAIPTVAHADTTDNVGTTQVEEATNSDHSPTTTKNASSATETTSDTGKATNSSTKNSDVNVNSSTTAASTTNTGKRTAVDVNDSTEANTTEDKTVDQGNVNETDSKTQAADDNATASEPNNSANSDSQSSSSSVNKTDKVADATANTDEKITTASNAQNGSDSSSDSSTNSAANNDTSQATSTTNFSTAPVTAANKPKVKAATKAATKASQSDRTKIVSVDKMNAKDKALHNLNNAWQGSAYAASIADDASGLDSITNQYFVDEWLPDKTLQQFIFDQLTSQAGKTITLPDSGKTLTITNGSNGTDIGIADVTEITKKDMQYLLALVSSKTTGTTIYDQKGKTLSADELFKNLEGIQYASNLQVLDLRGHDGVAVDMSEVAAVEKNLTYLALYGNGVTGKLDLGNTTSTLSDLYLERTGLTGDLSQLSGMAGLANVSIGNTVDGDSNWTSGMQGSAFPTTASSSTLQTLNLRGLGLTGTVPSLSSYSKATNIDISDNKLTGRLPELGASTLGTNANIRFNASNNLFSGTLPTSYLTNTWSEFKVANNLRLTGDVPLWYKINNPGVHLFNINDNYNHDGQVIGAVNHGNSASSADSYDFNNMTNVIPDGYDISGNYFNGSAIQANYVTSDLPALDQSKLTQKVNKVYDTSNYTIDSDGNLSLNETDLLGAGDVYKYLDGSTYYDGSEATKYVAGPDGKGYTYSYSGDDYTHATSHSFTSTPVVNGTVTATFEDGSTKSFTASDILTLAALQDATTGKNTATPHYKINMKKLFGDNYSNDSKAILSFNLSYDPTHSMSITQISRNTVDISASTGTQGSGLNYYANVTLGINATSLGDLSAGQDVANTYSPVVKNSDGTTTKIGSDIVVSGQTGLDVPATQLQDITYNGKTYHAKVGTNVVKNSDGTYSLTGAFGDTDSRFNIEYVSVGNVNVHYKVQHPDGTVTDMPSNASESIDESAHNVGDSVSVTAKTFDGYKIVGSTTSSVTLTDADQDVTFTFTNTAEEIAAGQTAGKTDGETGKTNDVANKSEDYQAGYKTANDATIKDYSAGQTAGYKDGVNGKTSGTTKPGSEITDTTAWKNGYDKGYAKGQAERAANEADIKKGKSDADKDFSKGTTSGASKDANGSDAYQKAYDDESAKNANDYAAGKADGQAGKKHADNSQKSKAYQSGYDSTFSKAKAKHDQDFSQGKKNGRKDRDAGKKHADNSNRSNRYQEGYNSRYGSGNDVMNTEKNNPFDLTNAEIAKKTEQDTRKNGDKQPNITASKSAIGNLPQTSENQSNGAEVAVGAAVLFATLGAAITVKRKKNND